MIKIRHIFKVRPSDHFGIRPFKWSSVPMARILFPFLTGLYLYTKFPIIFDYMEFVLLTFAITWVFTFKYFNTFSVFPSCILFGYITGLAHHPGKNIKYKISDEKFSGKFLLIKENTHSNYTIFRMYVHTGNVYHCIGKGRAKVISKRDSFEVNVMAVPLNNSVLSMNSNDKYRNAWHYNLYFSDQFHLTENEMEKDELEQVRSLFKNIFLKGISESQVAAFYIGLISGDTKGMSKEIIRYFQSSGTMHVLAVSGLHVGLLYISLGWIIGIMGSIMSIRIYPIILLVIQLTGVWYFGWFTGLPPSVTRACIMISVFALAKSLQIHSNGLNTLCFSALLQLHIQPWDLFSLGFQFSYLAVGGILWAQPFVNYINRFENNVLRNIFSVLLITIIAQSITLLVSLPNFHQFPVLFLPANMFSIPLTTLMTYAGFIFMLPLPGIEYCGFILEFLYNVLIFGMHWFSSFNFGSLDDIPVGASDYLLISVIILSIFLWLRNILSMIFLCRLILYCLVLHLIFRPSHNDMVIGKYNGNLWVLMVRNNTSVVVAMNEDEKFKRMIRQWLLTQGISGPYFYKWPPKGYALSWGDNMISSQRLVCDQYTYSVVSEKEILKQKSQRGFNNRMHYFIFQQGKILGINHFPMTGDAISLKRQS